ncbi:MAG: serine hydroxymethyltransferase [Candidatus Dojkabacteria bacterium]
MGSNLATYDKKLANLLEKEQQRQQDYITLIPSENYTHPAISHVLGSVATNKYSEGYPNRRYYNGNEFIDEIELLAIERTKEVFQGKFANVQPYSGSPANLAVYFALLKPGDKVMGLKLSHGGHLTHGAPVSFSGKWFQQVPIEAGEKDEIDYDRVRDQILKEKPKLILAGVTAYPLELRYDFLAKYAKEVGATLVADVSHTNGLVVAGVHKHPFEQGADIITSTTHKLLRGPRGAVIVSNDLKLAKKIDKAIMPGLQGGPHNHKTAALALAMKFALEKEYKDYVEQVFANSQKLASELIKHGFELVAGRTENHLSVVNLLEQDLLGTEAANMLEEAGIVVNANTIPNDPNPPLKPSGIRVGTPAITTRGMKEKEVVQIADWIRRVLLEKEDPSQIRKEVFTLTKNNPVPEAQW